MIKVINSDEDMLNIQIVIQKVYHSFEIQLLLSFFYFMIKSSKSFVKTGSRFQISYFFLFYKNFQLPTVIPTTSLI